jgi:hypothetical protein
MLEYQYCIEKDGLVEPSPHPSSADFIGIYLRGEDGLPKHLMDLNSKEDPQLIIKYLQRIFEDIWQVAYMQGSYGYYSGDSVQDMYDGIDAALTFFLSRYLHDDDWLLRIESYTLDKFNLETYKGHILYAELDGQIEKYKLDSEEERIGAAKTLRIVNPKYKFYTHDNELKILEL